jgi:glycosyltransferase involved in cell wall biosynthesis
MIKVSVILPVYNVAAYLDETFASLLCQTLQEIEIIAVNDGSKDNSEDIIKKYAQQDARISYFSQKNQGQSAARNLALQHAKGEYIYMMDSDDVLANPDALRICYEYAEQNKADFIFFDGDTLQEQGAAPLTWDYKRTEDLDESKAYNGERLLSEVLDKWKHNCVVWLLLIKHNYLKQIGLDFYPGIIHEDELFTTKLTLQSDKIFCLKKSFVKHRIRSASTMGIRYSKRNINCYLTVIDELLKWRDTPIIHKFAKYTLSKVFYTGHQIPFKEKPAVFLRAVKSGYLKYIGLKSAIVFWFKK